ncbi:MAG: hypothetical protein ACPLXC_00550 [Candidatus Pacearchaeota archaeon]
MGILSTGLLALNLFSQNLDVEPLLQPPEINVFEDDEDKKATQKDTLENKIIISPETIPPMTSSVKAGAKVENGEKNHNYGGKLEFGGKGYFGLYLDGEANPNGNLSLRPYLKSGFNDIWNNAAVGGMTKINGKNWQVNPNIELSKESSTRTDTLTNFRNTINSIQNGRAWSYQQDRQISSEEQENNGNMWGVGAEMNGENHSAIIQIGRYNTTKNNTITTIDAFLENYRDSTRTLEGPYTIITRTNTLTNVLTNLETIIKNKEDITKYRILYNQKFSAKIPLELALGAVLQHHIVENEVRNNLNSIVNVNGQTIVDILGGNQPYSDTIPFAYSTETRNRTRDFGREQINTDLFNFLISINKNGNVNNRFYFDKAFFNSNEWAVKNQFNYQTGSFVNALKAQINNSSFGFGIILALDWLKLGYVKELSKYLSEKEELTRNASMNDRQKALIQKYKDVELLTKLYGPYLLLDFKRIGGRRGYSEIKVELGYSVYDNGRIRGGIDFGEGKKKFYIGLGKAQNEGIISVETIEAKGSNQNQNLWKIGAEARFKFSD